MRFIHIADVHLDTAFAGRSEEVRSRLRAAAREALARCVETAVSEEVHAVLIAGDFFDGARLSFGSEGLLLRQLDVLAGAGIQVVYATGNHDPGAGQVVTDLAWPRNVTVIGGADPVTVTIVNRAGEPVGHVTGAGHATARETADLAQALRPRPDAGLPGPDAGLPGPDVGLPRPDTRLPQVALLHTQVTSASRSELHQPYAPSTLDHLRSAGFDYWALGHVHQRQALSDDPPVHYPGNLQGRNPRETGAKGGLLVDLHNPGHPVVEFREFSRVRWERLALGELEGARTLDALVELVVSAWEEARAADPGSDGTEWIVAVDLAGPSPVWRQLREREELGTLEQECADCIGAMSVEIRAGRTHAVVRLDDHIDRKDALGASLRLCRRVAAGDDRLGLTEADLAGFDRERHGSIEQYLQRLLDGGSAEIMARMLADSGGPAQGEARNPYRTRAGADRTGAP